MVLHWEYIAMAKTCYTEKRTMSFVFHFRVMYQGNEARQVWQDGRRGKAHPV